MSALFSSLPASTLNAGDIARRVPHSGAMCLLHSISQWDEETIVAHANHRADSQHPLAILAQLDATAGIEYAAQAMAVHGALLGEVAASKGQVQRIPQMGFLASVRNVVCHQAFLHDQKETLTIHATRTAGTESPVSYEFSVHSGDVECVTGKATVVLNFSE
jgi:predicted hotdog family 3-hydroxylacyl-ACP dehydratase